MGKKELMRMAETRMEIFKEVRLVWKEGRED